MTEIGFHCSHEQHTPSALLRLTTLAADAGFRAAMCSDHFHPWTAVDGHSGFAWSWLGAALSRTPLSFGTVCAPGQRYHPAVVAQAAATLSEMFPDRFWLALGSGEALNERITADGWPTKSVRAARLEAAIDVIRALWRGEEVSADGLVRIESARLFTLPTRAPLMVGAALTPDTARRLGPLVDALITVAGPRESMRAVIEAFRETAGREKPLFLQAAVSYAPTDAEAAEIAWRAWPHCALTPAQLADLATPSAFDAAAGSVSRQDVLARVRVASDISRHCEWLAEDIAMGFSRVYLHNVARSYQERFIDACGRHLLPILA